MAEITSVIPGIAPVLPNPNPTIDAVVGTNPVLAVADVGETAQMTQKVGLKEPKDFFLQNVLVRKITITNTDTPTTVLGAVDFDPLKDYLVNDLVKSRWRGYANLRAGYVLTVVATIPGTCYGAYNIVAIPDGGYDSVGFDNVVNDSYVTGRQSEHAIINCEMQNTIQLELPFLLSSQAMALSPTVGYREYPMWRVRVWAESAIQSSIAATATGTLLFYVRLMEGYSFENRQLQSKSFPVPKKTSTRFAGLSSAVSHFGSKVPVLKPFTEAAAAGLAVASGVADLFGYTREAMPTTPSPFMRRLFSNPLTVDGTDGSEILALYNSNAVAIDAAVAGGPKEDPMSLEYLFAKWTIIKRMEISTATAVGVVANVAVSPGVGFADGNTFHMTAAGYVGLPFSWWSGDMEYMVYIPSSPNLKGALQVFWSPEPVLAFATDPTVWLNGHMIDLCGSSRTHLVVPMAAPNPTRVLYPIESSVVIPYRPEATNGFLVFYLTTQLVAPRVGATLPIMILARGGSNMRFHVPNVVPIARTEDTTKTKSMSNYICFQGPVEDGDDNVGEVMVNLNPTVSSPPLDSVYFGETFESVRALVQRFSQIGYVRIANVTDDGGGDISGFFGVTYPPVKNVRGTVLGVGNSGNFIPRGVQAPRYEGSSYISTSWTWVGHYLPMYTGYRGGHRVKVIQCPSVSGPTANSNNLLAVAVPAPSAKFLTDECSTNNNLLTHFGPNTGNLFTDCSPLPLNKTDVGIEYTVPYYSPFRYGPTRLTNGDQLAAWDEIAWPYHNPGARGIVSLSLRPDQFSEQTVERIEAQVWVAASSDVGVSRFRRIPALNYLAIEDDTPA